MFMVGLTGGIGSGKTSVSEALASLGAVVIDADRIVRDLQQPGQPVLASMVELLGKGILHSDGSLDRQAVADVVFHDADQLKALNGIVHPAVHVEIFRRLDELRPTDELVVLDIPLLTESGWADLDAVIVVDLDPAVAVDRLVNHRGFARDDAEARIANQASREERAATATWVLDNSGSVDDLRAEIERVWALMREMQAASAAGD